MEKFTVLFLCGVRLSAALGQRDFMCLHTCTSSTDIRKVNLNFFHHHFRAFPRRNVFQPNDPNRLSGRKENFSARFDRWHLLGEPHAPFGCERNAWNNRELQEDYNVHTNWKRFLCRPIATRPSRVGDGNQDISPFTVSRRKKVKIHNSIES